MAEPLVDAVRLDVTSKATLTGLDQSLTKLKALQAALDNIPARLAGLSTGPGLNLGKAVQPPKGAEGAKQQAHPLRLPISAQVRMVARPVFHFARFAPLRGYSTAVSRLKRTKTEIEELLKAGSKAKTMPVSEVAKTLDIDLEKFRKHVAEGKRLNEFRLPLVGPSACWRPGMPWWRVEPHQTFWVCVFASLR